MKNPKLILLDCCQSDYFRGHSNRTLVAYPTNETTVKEIVDDLLSDANSGELEKEFCNYSWDDLDKAVERFLTEHKEILNKPIFPDLEPIPEDDNDDWESCIAYFTVIDEDPKWEID